MLTISLTSIPPRFETLPRVLDGLLRQTAVSRVLLHIPAHYRRFGPAPALPRLADQVELFRPSQDHGPATKLLGALEAGVTGDILICDDDCLYAPTWAETLLAARRSARYAVAASSFEVSRLKRKARAPHDRIVQGFGGILVRSEMFDASVFDMPAAAYAADDIWFSGHLALRGHAVVAAASARTLCRPFTAAGPSLQDSSVGGMTRAEANQSCLDELTRKYGLWPPLEKT